MNKGRHHTEWGGGVKGRVPIRRDPICGMAGKAHHEGPKAEKDTKKED
jgi:hypothetical protein